MRTQARTQAAQPTRRFLCQLSLLLLLAVSLCFFHTHAHVASQVTAGLAHESASSATSAGTSSAGVAAPDLPATATQPPGDFVPTHEWQVVAPDQAIPPGLWVRVDMSTGVKTARLLPEEEKNEAQRQREARHAAAQGLVVVPQEEQEQESTEASTSGPVLRVLPEPGGEAPRDEMSAKSEAALLAARRARLAQLKEHFYLKEDVEQMKQLLAVCVDPASSVSDVVQALGFLEEYLHQVDNANDWAHIGGLDVALMLLQQKHEEITDVITMEVPVVPEQGSMVGVDGAQHNDTGAVPAPPAPVDLQLQRLYSLQAAASLVLGTAAQNNRRVQEQCRKEGAVQIVTELLQRTMAEEMAADAASSSHGRQQAQGAPSEDTVTVTAFQLRSARLKLLAKLLYSLSALLRNNARNQALFQRAGGASALRLTLPDTWPRCGPAASDSGASSVSCVSASESASLYGLRATVHSKLLGLLHDIVLDHTLNAVAPSAWTVGQGQGQEQGGEQSTTRAVDGEISDDRLFEEVTSREWCAFYLQRATAPFQPPTSTNDGGIVAPSRPSTVFLHTRERALATLSALLNHTPCECLAVLRADGSAQAALEAVAQQHEKWALQEAATQAQDGEEGESAYHEELREAALKISVRLAR